MAKSYIKPPLFVRRVFNPIAMRFGIAETLTVRGRKSGELRRVPITPVEVEGVRYLCSPRGATIWALNLAAAGEGELRHKGAVQRFKARDVPTDERAAIIVEYRKLVPKSVGKMFEQIPDVAEHPTFRIEPL
jgi:deazaflavin-dependent oxidoreductase (nitroreductase family)